MNTKTVKFEFHKELFDRAESIAKERGIPVGRVMSAALEVILASAKSADGNCKCLCVSKAKPTLSMADARVKAFRVSKASATRRAAKVK